MTPNFDSCPNCGGRLVGDGYTLVIHCETIDPPSDVEVDARPIYCEFQDPSGESFA